MSATILAFVPSAVHSTPNFGGTCVIPFMLPAPPPMRCGNARLGQAQAVLDRADARWKRADALWQKAQARAKAREPAASAVPAAVTPEAPIPDPPPEPQVSVATPVRATLKPNPLWPFLDAVERVGAGIYRLFRPVLCSYFLVVCAISVPMATIARIWWLAAYCAVMGLVFARLVLADVREWRSERRNRRQPAQDDSDCAARHYRIRR